MYTDRTVENVGMSLVCASDGEREECCARITGARTTQRIENKNRCNAKTRLADKPPRVGVSIDAFECLRVSSHDRR